MADSVGKIVGGLALTFVAGIFNGSWNASFSPRVALAVKSEGDEKDACQATLVIVDTITRFSDRLSSLLCRRGMENKPDTKRIDLEYHHAFLLFQLYAVIINVPICISWIGGLQRTTYIVSQAPASSVILVVLFSILWGVGSLFFGLACRVAGVGIGTNLSMGVVVVIGTFLPLVLKGVIKTAAGVIICVGLSVCCVGLYFSMASLQSKERSIFETANKADLKIMANDENKFIGDIQTKNEEYGSFAENDIDKENQQHGKGSELSTIEDDFQIDPNRNLSDEEDADLSSTKEAREPSSAVKIGICILAGTLSSLLQFAFVFGQPLVDIASTNDGVNGSTTSSGTTAIIWLFAISLGAPPSIVYCLINSPPHIPLKTLWSCPWWRHLLLIFSTSLPWVAQIHLYGLANVLLPAEVSASVAWPVLMMVSVGQGMILSICLGEWKEAPRLAWRQLITGLFLTFVGICLIMVSLAA